MALEGYASLAPLYFIVETTASTSSSQDPKGYAIPLKYAKSFLLALLCTTGILVLLTIGSIFQFTRYWNRIGQSLISSLVLNTPVPLLIVVSIIANTKHRSMSRRLFGYEDVSYIVGTLQLAAILSAFTHLCNVLLGFIELRYYGSKYGGDHCIWLVELLFGGRGLSRDVKEKYWLFVAFSMLWCLWNVVNIRRRREQSLWMIARLLFQMLVGSVFAGPGATMAVLWIGREDKTRCLDSRLRNNWEGENKHPEH